MLAADGRPLSRRTQRVLQFRVTHIAFRLINYIQLHYYNCLCKGTEKNSTIN